MILFFLLFQTFDKKFLVVDVKELHLTDRFEINEPFYSEFRSEHLILIDYEGDYQKIDLEGNIIDSNNIFQFNENCNELSGMVTGCYFLEDALVIYDGLKSNLLLFDINEHTLHCQSSNLSNKLFVHPFLEISISILENPINHYWLQSDYFPSLQNDHQLSTNDRILSNGIKSRTMGDFILIHTTQSIQSAFQYRLFQVSSKKLILEGQCALVDQRPSQARVKALQDPNPKRTVPVIRGSSVSSELGFVLTEHAIPENYRILRILGPDSRTWTSVQVQLEDGDLRDLWQFTHLKGSFWFAKGDKFFILTLQDQKEKQP